MSLSTLTAQEAVEIACDLQYHIKHPEILRELSQAGDNPDKLSRILAYYRRKI